MTHWQSHLVEDFGDDESRRSKRAEQELETFLAGPAPSESTPTLLQRWRRNKIGRHYRRVAKLLWRKTLAPIKRKKDDLL
jgi:hypothetical protein